MPTTMTATDRWISAADRCDRCGAAGFVVALFSGGELVFCAHHGREYSATLAASAVMVLDESDRVLSA